MWTLSMPVTPGVSTLVLAAVFGAAPALAHHSSARFDSGRTVAFEGALKGVRWANPHVYLIVEQVTDSGDTIEWEVETVGPSALARLGWSRDTLSARDRVSLRGNPARRGDYSLNLLSLESGDRSLNLMALIREYASPGPTPAVGASSLDGTWAVLPNLALITPFLPSGPQPALTAAGAAAAEAFDEASMLPALECVESPAPYFMFILDAKRIVTDGDVIRILGDYEGAERAIHMDVTDHEGATPSIHGHSIGRWEGSTLVIETTHFADHAMAHGFGVPSGARKRLVERLTRSEDGTRIAYHFEVSDPEFLVAPITGDAEWAYRPDLELALETCDPEAARRFAVH
jgi:hypothetical protein